MEFCTKIKLSWMHFDFRNVDCAGQMMELMTDANLIEGTLEMSLVTEWIKLMGLKWVISVAPSFFGRSVIVVLLIIDMSPPERL